MVWRRRWERWESLWEGCERKRGKGSIEEKDMEEMLKDLGKGKNVEESMK